MSGQLTPHPNAMPDFNGIVSEIILGRQSFVNRRIVILTIDLKEEGVTLILLPLVDV